MADMTMETEHQYPLTIIADRYGGAYSGGKYLAWALDHWNVPFDASDGDRDCMLFWAENTIPVGRGDTPNEAMEDLIRRLETGEDDRPRTAATIFIEELNKKRAERDKRDEAEHK